MTEQRRRKGVIHVLEAVLAAILLLGLLILASPTEDSSNVQGKRVQEQVFRTLHSLDTAGQLRSPVAARNVEQVRTLVEQRLPDRNVEVAMLVLNQTTDETTFAGTHTDTFTVGDATERETVRIWYRDAAAPNVSINGNYISNHTGMVQDEYETIDIVQATTTGTNTFRIDVAASSDIGYSIDVYERLETGTPPGNRDVFTTSYLVSGVNESAHPTEVTVISWQ